MRRIRLLLVAAAAAVGLVGCSDAPDERATGVTTTTIDGPKLDCSGEGDSVGPDYVVADDAHWALFEDPAAVDAPPGEDVLEGRLASSLALRLDRAEAVSLASAKAKSATHVLVPDDAHDEAAASLSSGHRLITSFTYIHRSRDLGTYGGSRLVLDVASDAEVSVLGRYCDRDAVEDYLASIVSAYDPAVGIGEFFDRVVSDDSGPEAHFLSVRGWQKNRQRPAWEDLDPMERVLVPDAAPANLLAKYSPHKLPFVLPESWRNIELIICSRTDDGWTPTCASPAAALPDGLLFFQYFSRPGLDVTLSLARDEPSPPNELAVAAVIPAGDGPYSAEVTASARTASTAEELIEVAQREPVFVIHEGPE